MMLTKPYLICLISALLAKIKSQSSLSKNAEQYRILRMVLFKMLFSNAVHAGQVCLHHPTDSILINFLIYLMPTKMLVECLLLDTIRIMQSLFQNHSQNHLDQKGFVTFLRNSSTCSFVIKSSFSATKIFFYSHRAAMKIAWII